MVYLYSYKNTADAGVFGQNREIDRFGEEGADQEYAFPNKNRKTMHFVAEVTVPSSP